MSAFLFPPQSDIRLVGCDLYHHIKGLCCHWLRFIRNGSRIWWWMKSIKSELGVRLRFSRACDTIFASCNALVTLSAIHWDIEMMHEDRLYVAIYGFIRFVTWCKKWNNAYSVRANCWGSQEMFDFYLWYWLPKSWSKHHKWGRCCQKQVSQEGINNYIPQ